MSRGKSAGFKELKILKLLIFFLLFVCLLFKVRRISLEQYIKAIQNTDLESIRQIADYLNIPYGGATYRMVHKIRKKYNLDISHWKGQSCNKGQIFGPKRPIEDYLNNKAYITSYALKRRLIKEKIKEHKCEICLNTTWLDQPIPLELHHENSNHSDNTLSNLKLVCPNCHTTTDNYRAKKKGKSRNAIISENVLVEAIKTTNNKRQALIKVGLAAKGGNYRRIDNLIEKYNLQFLPN